MRSFCILAENCENIDFLLPVYLTSSDHEGSSNVLVFELNNHNESSEALAKVDAAFDTITRSGARHHVSFLAAVRRSRDRVASALRGEPELGIVRLFYFGIAQWSVRGVPVEEIYHRVQEPVRDVLDELVCHGEPLVFRRSRSQLRVMNKKTGYEYVVVSIERDCQGGWTLRLGGGLSISDRQFEREYEISHLGGDYSILKTLAFGDILMVPWYLRQGDVFGRAIEVWCGFEPVYSMRIDRRVAVRRAFRGENIAKGFIWDFDLRHTQCMQGEAYHGIFYPSVGKRALLQVAMRPTFGRRRREAAALDVIEGVAQRGLAEPAVVSGLEECCRLASTALEEAVFPKLLALVLGEEIRRLIFSANNLPHDEITAATKRFEPLAARCDIAREYVSLCWESLRSTESGREKLRMCVLHERAIVSMLKTELCEYWDCVEEFYRATIPRLLLLGVSASSASSSGPQRQVHLERGALNFPAMTLRRGATGVDG